MAGVAGELVFHRFVTGKVKLDACGEGWHVPVISPAGGVEVEFAGFVVGPEGDAADDRVAGGGFGV